MSHKKKNKKYVIIDAKFGNNERFLGNRIHPGLSAAISWCEKHYPEESADIETNFSIRCVSHDKLTNIFLEEMRSRLPKSTTDRELLLSMAESLVQGGGVRILSAAQKAQKIAERKRVSDSNKNCVNQLKRYDMCRAFQHQLTVKG